MPQRLQQPHNVIRILAESYYFQGFDEATLAVLAQGTVLKSFKSGEILFLEEEACSGLHIIQTGSVKLFKIAPNGREFILRILEKGASFNEVPVFDGGGNPVNAAALDPVEVWIVKKEIIRAVLAEQPELHQLILLKLAQNLRLFVKRMEDLAFYQVSQRLAHLLLEESRTTGPVIAMKQDELAARLGTVREVTSRALRELEHCGAIKVARRQIHILDEERLRSCS